jgi:hypothetical protein
VHRGKKLCIRDRTVKERTNQLCALLSSTFGIIIIRDEKRKINHDHAISAPTS